MVSSGKSAWIIPHAVLLLGLGLVLVLFPVYVAFVASSLPLQDILDAPMTLVPPTIAMRLLWGRPAPTANRSRR